MNKFLDYLLVVLSHREIFGFDGGGLNRVISELSEYNQQSMLQTCSKVGVVLNSKPQGNTEIQVRLVQEIFSGDLELRKLIAKAIKDKVQDPRWVVFTDQALLTLLDLTLVHCKNTGGKMVEEADVHRFGLWMLIITDEIGDFVHNNDIFVERKLEIELIREHLTKQFFLMEQKNIKSQFNKVLFMSEIELDDYPDTNIKKLFNIATDGLSLTEYLVVSFMLYAKWINVDTSPTGIQNVWFTNWVKYFENTSINKSTIEKYQRFALTSPKDYCNQRSKTIEQYLSGKNDPNYNLLTLRDKPLIRADNDVFVLSHPNLLIEKATEGVYWIISNYFKEIDTQKFKDFPNYWGKIYEKFINEKLKISLGDVCYPNYTYDQKEKADCVVNLGNTVLIIEIKYAHWSQKSIVYGKRDDMKPTLTQLFTKKKGIGQIYRFIDEIVSNKTPLPFSYDKQRILPIIVQGESIPMDYINRRMYEDTYTDNFRLSVCNPFIVLNTEEVDLLLSIATGNGIKKAEELLITYSNLFYRDKNGQYCPNAISFKNYLNSIQYQVPITKENNRGIDILFADTKRMFKNQTTQTKSPSKS